MALEEDGTEYCTVSRLSPTTLHGPKSIDAFFNQLGTASAPCCGADLKLATLLGAVFDLVRVACGWFGTGLGLVCAQLKILLTWVLASSRLALKRVPRNESCQTDLPWNII